MGRRVDGDPRSSLSNSLHPIEKLAIAIAGTSRCPTGTAAWGGSCAALSFENGDRVIVATSRFVYCILFASLLFAATISPSRDAAR
jgi:hypothetical protein